MASARPAEPAPTARVPPSGVPPRPWERTPAPAHAGATPLSPTIEPAPAVRITNVRKPAEFEPPPPTDADERLFPEEGSAEGCASGECLPDVAPPDPEPEPVQALASSGRDNPSRTTAERWRAAVEYVKSQSVRHGAALANGRLLWLRTGEIGLAYRPQDGFHRVQISSSTGRAIVDKALAEHFGRPMKLAFEDAAADSAPQSIAEEEANSRAAHEKSTEGKVRAHPAVRSILKLLGGEIEHVQVYEPERPSAVRPSDASEESS
ncbi:DNA polymerase III subunit gamma/tau [Myxococcaceae bacterium GXIMD 01537]